MYTGYLTDVDGIKVGHFENKEALTGTTVIIAEEGARGGVCVRGQAPGTREISLLSSEKTVDMIHGLVLTGGSAFGLDAAGGVMRFLEEKGIGIDMGVTKVPIVPAAVIFDLLLGDGKIRPDFHMGYEAAKRARKEERRQGCLGAGMGASVGKILGMDHAMKSGLGSASIKHGDLQVAALVVVNAMGDVYDLEERQIAGPMENGKLCNTLEVMKTRKDLQAFLTNTTIGVVATNGKLTKPECNGIASISHNAYAKRIRPVHTSSDGDTIFTMATNQVHVHKRILEILAVEVMEKAIVNALESASAWDKIDMKLKGDSFFLRVKCSKDR